MVAFVCMWAEGNVYDFYFVENPIWTSYGCKRGIWAIFNTNTQEIIGACSLLESPHVIKLCKHNTINQIKNEKLGKYLATVNILKAPDIMKKIELLKQNVYSISLYMDHDLVEIARIERHHQLITIHFKFNDQTLGIQINLSKIDEEQTTMQRINKIYSENSKIFSEGEDTDNLLSLFKYITLSKPIDPIILQELKRSATRLAHSLLYLFPNDFYTITLSIYSAFARSSVQRDYLMAFAAGLFSFAR